MMMTTIMMAMVMMIIVIVMAMANGCNDNHCRTGDGSGGATVVLMVMMTCPCRHDNATVLTRSDGRYLYYIIVRSWWCMLGSISDIEHWLLSCTLL